MTTLQINLRLAEYAVNHVAAIIAKGPGPYNRPESVVHRIQSPPIPTVTSGPSPQPPPFQPSMLDNLLGRGRPQTAWEQQQSAEHQAQNTWKADRDQRLADKTEQIRALVETQRTALKKYSSVMYTATSSHLDSARAAVSIGGLVQLSALGNCGEQSCVAFRYLLARGATGLAIVDWKSANHTFVVIGMDPNVARTSFASLNQPPAWGDTAVVCDPWYHEWFPAQSATEWRRKMKRILAETNQLAPEFIDQRAATNAGRAAEYGANMDGPTRFERLTFLTHPDLTLQRLAMHNDALSASKWMLEDKFA